MKKELLKALKLLMVTAALSAISIPVLAESMSVEEYAIQLSKDENLSAKERKQAEKEYAEKLLDANEQISVIEAEEEIEEDWSFLIEQKQALDAEELTIYNYYLKQTNQPAVDKLPDDINDTNIIRFLLNEWNYIDESDIDKQILENYIRAYIRRVDDEDIIRKYDQIFGSTATYATAKSSNANYNSTKAVAYANKWNGAAYGTDSKTGYNNSVFGAYDADCANFVSQCLLTGGFERNVTWDYWYGITGKYNTTVAWATADGLFNYLLDTADSENYYWKLSKIQTASDFEDVYDVTYKGDAMFLTNSRGRAYHAMIATDYSKSSGYYNLLYSGHTANRDRASGRTMAISSYNYDDGAYLEVISFN